MAMGGGGGGWHVSDFGTLFSMEPNIEFFGDLIDFIEVNFYAEIVSPNLNLINLKRKRPRTAHYDLRRLKFIRPTPSLKQTAANHEYVSKTHIITSNPFYVATIHFFDLYFNKKHPLYSTLLQTFNNWATPIILPYLRWNRRDALKVQTIQLPVGAAFIPFCELHQHSEWKRDPIKLHLHSTVIFCYGFDRNSINGG